MKLTYKLIHSLFNNGSPNSPQKALLNLPTKLPRGWLQRLIGTEINESDYARLLSMKGPRPKGVATAAWKAGIVPQRKPALDDPELTEWL